MGPKPTGSSRGKGKEEGDRYAPQQPMYGEPRDASQRGVSMRSSSSSQNTQGGQNAPPVGSSAQHPRRGNSPVWPVDNSPVWPVERAPSSGLSQRGRRNSDTSTTNQPGILSNSQGAAPRLTLEQTFQLLPELRVPWAWDWRSPHAPIPGTRPTLAQALQLRPEICVSQARHWGSPHAPFPGRRGTSTTNQPGILSNSQGAAPRPTLAQGGQNVLSRDTQQQSTPSSGPSQTHTTSHEPTAQQNLQGAADVSIQRSDTKTTSKQRHPPPQGRGTAPRTSSGINDSPNNIPDAVQQSLDRSGSSKLPSRASQQDGPAAVPPNRERPTHPSGPQVVRRNSDISAPQKGKQRVAPSNQKGSAIPAFASPDQQGAADARMRRPNSAQDGHLPSHTEKPPNRPRSSSVGATAAYDAHKAQQKSLDVNFEAGFILGSKELDPSLRAQIRKYDMLVAEAGLDERYKQCLPEIREFIWNIMNGEVKVEATILDHGLYRDQRNSTKPDRGRRPVDWVKTQTELHYDRRFSGLKLELPTFDKVWTEANQLEWERLLSNLENNLSRQGRLGQGRFESSNTDVCAWQLQPEELAEPAPDPSRSAEVSSHHSIHVVDDKDKKILPVLGVAHLRLEFQTCLGKTTISGSGWLLDKDTVVTAGHCVMGPGEHLITVEVSLALDEYSRKDVQYGSHVATSWNYFSSLEPKYDLALVRVSKTFEEGTPIDWVPAPEEGTINVTVIGYPEFEQRTDKMYTGSSISQSSQSMFPAEIKDGRLQHFVTTSGGSSGGPVLDKSNRVIAVHSGGNHDKKTNYATILKGSGPNNPDSILERLNGIKNLIDTCDKELGKTEERLKEKERQINARNEIVGGIEQQTEDIVSEYRKIRRQRRGVAPNSEDKDDAEYERLKTELDSLKDGCHALYGVVEEQKARIQELSKDKLRLEGQKMELEKMRDNEPGTVYRVDNRGNLVDTVAVQSRVYPFL